MSQHDLIIENQGFPAFRADLNNALEALGSTQSGTTAPAVIYANQLWFDTTNNIIKFRNADNDAWINLFTLDQVNDAIATLSLASIVVTGDGSFTGTGQVKLPAGTTAQRSGTPLEGMIRYNSDLDKFEGYSNGLWGTLGGGATGGGTNEVFVLNDQTVTNSYTIPTGKNASSAGAITIDTGVTVTVSTGSTWVIV